MTQAMKEKLNGAYKPLVLAMMSVIIALLGAWGANVNSEQQDAAKVQADHAVAIAENKSRINELGSRIELLVSLAKEQATRSTRNADSIDAINGRTERLLRLLEQQNAPKR